MRNYTGRIACAALALGFTQGVVQSWFYPGNPFPVNSFVFTIVGAFLVFLWFRMDTDRLLYRRSPFLSVAVVAVAILAIPYYLFRTRGFVKGVAGVLAFLGIFVAYCLMTGLGAILVRIIRP